MEPHGAVQPPTRSESTVKPNGKTNGNGSGPGSQHLSGIFEMLTTVPAVRDDLVDDIRAQINQGSYLSDEKLNLAIYRLLKDILR